MMMTPQAMLYWTIATAVLPVLPALLHAVGWDNTAVGRVVTALLPDVIGAFKRMAPPPEK